MPACHLRLITVLVSLCALLVLGCSDSTGPEPPPPDPPLGAEGVVNMPAGMAGAPQDFKVLTGAGESSVSSDGAFRAALADTGLSMVVLVDADDKPVLIGYVDTDLNAGTPGEISAHETATALLFYALGVFTLPGDAQIDVIKLIRTHPATGDLAAAVATALAADTLALTAADSPLLDDIAAAVTEITAEKATEAAAAGLLSHLKREDAGVTVAPTEPQSGIVVAPSPDGVGLQVTNRNRRNAWYYVYKTGYEDFDGNAFEVTPPQHVADGFVGPTGRLLGGQTSLHDWTSGAGGFQPRVSETIALEVASAESKAIFETAVAGGYLRADVGHPDWYDSTDSRHVAWDARAHDMLMLTLVKELLAPAIFGVGSPLNRLEPDLDVDHLELARLGRNLLEQNFLAVGQFNAGYWASAVKIILGDMASNEPSRQTIINIIELLLESAGLGDRVLKVISDLTVLTAAIERGAVDAGRVLADNTGTQRIDRWDVSVNVSMGLTATRTILNPENIDSIITAEVEGLGNQQFCYRWTLEGIGELSPFLGGSAVEGESVVTDDPQIQYLADPTEIFPGLIATVHCQAFLKESGVDCTDPPAGAAVGEASIELQGGACDLRVLADETHLVPFGTTTFVQLAALGCDAVPAPFCVRWTVIGSGRILLSGVSGPEADFRTAGFYIDNEDIVEGGESIVRAELYGAACGSYGPEDLQSSDEVVLVHDPLDELGPGEPCVNTFNYAAWSQNSNGMTVNVSGSVGQLITVNVAMTNTPPDYSRFYVDVLVPQATPYASLASVSGSEAWISVAGANYGGWHSYAEGLPDIYVAGALIRVSTMGSFSLTVPTEPYAWNCEESYYHPCCPRNRASPAGPRLHGTYVEVDARTGSFWASVVTPVYASSPTPEP